MNGCCGTCKYGHYDKMQGYKDKYYIQNEIVYKCTRDSGNALQNDIIDLIGHYFEVA